jgi:uncharacterized surface protein with fasciclin (FAS1) repeats
VTQCRFEKELTGGPNLGARRAHTAEGQSITIDTSDGVKVDNAKVIKTDVKATNGVIHVIDSVIMPK